MLYAGIDGGGTSTRLELRDEKNQLVSRHYFGPFNISSIGEAAFRSLIRQIGSSHHAERWAVLCVGGAGISFPGLQDIILEELSSCGFSGKLILRPDYAIALHGAIHGPGCVLITGTGSVGYGENGPLSARVGGWGHLIDDTGSGYAIGRDALAAAVKHLDGRQHAPELCHRVLKAIHGHGIPDILNYVYYQGRDKSDIARLAGCVLEGAEAGDATCISILRVNTQSLVPIVQALSAQLALDLPEVALLGGLTENNALYHKMVKTELSKVCHVIPAEHDALWGAAQFAWENRSI